MGGAGVGVGSEGVGVLEVPKEAQAVIPVVRSRVKTIRLKNILEIIPKKKTGLSRVWDEPPSASP